jgi:hypothetical protein
MFARLFPKQISTSDRSNLFATLLLIPIVALKLLMSINAMVMTRFVASKADGIPLDRYGAEGAQAVMAFFSIWGMEQALLALFGLLALVRYRSLVPLAYVLLSIEHFGRKGLFAAYPFNRLGSEGGAAAMINWALMTFLLVGLLFAFFGKTGGATRRAAEPAV